MIIKPAISVRGSVRMPGDKSISHRAAMFSAIADGTSVLTNFAESEDCRSTLECLIGLGVEIDRNGPTVRVSGVGLRGLKAPEQPLDCGNSGTTMRLLAGILAGQKFNSTLIGDASLSRRPMARIIHPLTEMGAAITTREGHAPLQIEGASPLKRLKFELPVASAQLKSCVLLAGLFAEGETTVIEPVRTRDHTERMLRGFGADLNVMESGGQRSITVSGGSILTARDVQVPGDISSAAFFLVAAACLTDSCIEMVNVGLNPTRDGIVKELRRFGVNVETADVTESGGEPIGTLKVSDGSELGGKQNRIEGAIVANLIDEVPILAVLGTQLKGGLEIRGAGELRIKESDRIASIVENLRRMNADVTEFEDGFRVNRSALKGAEIDPFGDHRIAMAFSIAGLLAQGETQINNPECAAVSFPDFYETLESVTVR